MKLNKRILRILITAAIMLFVLFSNVAVAEGPWMFKFQHNPKRMCETEGANFRVLPGQYATPVIIYNPNDQTVKIFKKVSLIYPTKFEDHKKESDWIEHELQPHTALDIGSGDVPGAVGTGSGREHWPARQDVPSRPW